MLEIKDISKQYITGNYIQKALDHVSLNLRDNEFVAILGPSGSGKTTLLNIIGGLDRYDFGDLIINGVSTRQYKDRDWDSYRNHTIGFVFQSYNLIPHQTILSNVELALTISGITGEQRRLKAEEALRKVGLFEQMHKHPNQLSGGQMQRVAIARALVNDPDILLADEPTGALDSDTSVQVMDLLKEVAEDRLVVMVTHNPELAKAYANRIVQLKDGHILDDTHPFIPETVQPAVHRNLGHAAMSFTTALALSFQNLRSKATRTLLVAFAGSIGIIGIALILSLSTGVNRYIQSIEEETLSEYPLTITSETYSLTDMMGISVDTDNERDTADEVSERRTVTAMFKGQTKNDLAAYKQYLDVHKEEYDPYVRAIEYSYQITPEIYIQNGEDYRRVNPDQTLSALGFSSSGASDLLSMTMSSDVFSPLPENESLYVHQYDLKAGHWPNNPYELVVVLSPSGYLSDITLYDMGLKDYDELKEWIDAYKDGEDVSQYGGPLSHYRYEDLLKVSFKLVDKAALYHYDTALSLWIDKSDDGDYMNALLDRSPDLKVVGVVQMKEEAEIGMLKSGLAYLPSLIETIMSSASQYDIVRQQIDKPTINVFTGKRFADEETGVDFSKLFQVDEDKINGAFHFDMPEASLSQNDLMAGIDFNQLLSKEDMMGILPPVKPEDIGGLMNGVVLDWPDEKKQLLASFIADGFWAYDQTQSIYAAFDADVQRFLAGEQAATIIQDTLNDEVNHYLERYDGDAAKQLIKESMAAFPSFLNTHAYEDVSQMETYLDEYMQSDEFVTAFTQALNTFLGEEYVMSESVLNALRIALNTGYQNDAALNGSSYKESLKQSFSAYMGTEEVQTMLKNMVLSSLDMNAFTQNYMILYAGQSAYVLEKTGSLVASAVEKVSKQLAQNMADAMEKQFSGLEDGFSFDADSFSSAISLSKDESELSEIFASMLNNSKGDYKGNLRTLGYAEDEDPYMITLFPQSFEAKSELSRLIEEYNASMQDSHQEEKVLSYTDIVGTLMSSVTDIVNAISYVLIAFVAISLVVSSIMIGVITYISVLERRKEIGILRAIGASKRNISGVFNAETFIIGLLAGVLGVAISEALLIPINGLIVSLTGLTNIKAVLPVQAIGILITLSVVLTLLGGLIPAKKAANSDPVAALRSE